MVPRVLTSILCVALVVSVSGCRQWFLDSADREVAELIKQRQMAALGETFDTSLPREDGNIPRRDPMYNFVPSPVDSTVPENFQSATPTDEDMLALEAQAKAEEEARFEAEAQAAAAAAAEGDANPDAGGDAESDEAGDAKKIPDVLEPPALPEVGDLRTMQLSEVLAYAIRKSRDYQTEKEALYLTALDLTLERFLWTPRFVDSVLSFDYINNGQVSEFDQALTAVSNFAVEQRLPYGGEVTARVINTLIRDIDDNLTNAETGQASLSARIPLLRGAGPVAYESRYQLERDLVYAVRRFERFRREFLVDIAGQYFNLQSLKARIASAEGQMISLRVNYSRDKALAAAQRILPIEADRTRVSWLNAQNSYISAQETYYAALDFFKINLGMPTDEPITVPDATPDELDEDVEQLFLLDPEIEPSTAISTALDFRLDLLTTKDAVDDARRGVRNAENTLLPRMDFNGSVTFDTEPNKPRVTEFDSDRTTWRASLDFEIPLNRQAERNVYRRSLISLRRAERAYDNAYDIVRLEVRRALRRLVRAKFSIGIQDEQIRINKFRQKLAQAKFESGQLTSNRDIVEALNDLRDAENARASAEADFRSAVLDFLLSTGTLRVDDSGKWRKYPLFPEKPLAAADAG